MPYKERIKLYEAQKRHRVKIRTLLLEYLTDKACIDCGEKDPIVLEFDHVSSNNKFKIIARMLSGHYSWKSVQAEIVKCEIRCANCHRRKTYVQFGYWGKNKQTKPL